VNEIEYYLAELEGEEEEREKERIINELNSKLFEIDDELNRKILCERCNNVIGELTYEYGNEEMARFLYIHDYDYHIQWFSPYGNEFQNIVCLAKGDFGEVNKATWIYGSHYGYAKDEVALKRIYNSSNKISDIIEEVKSW